MAEPKLSRCKGAIGAMLARPRQPASLTLTPTVATGLTIPAGTAMANITVTGGPAFWAVDGDPLTAPILVGLQLGLAALRTFQVISADGTVEVDYYAMGGL